MFRIARIQINQASMPTTPPPSTKPSTKVIKLGPASQQILVLTTGDAAGAKDGAGTGCELGILFATTTMSTISSPIVMTNKILTTQIAFFTVVHHQCASCHRIGRPSRASSGMRSKSAGYIRLSVNAQAWITGSRSLTSPDEVPIGQITRSYPPPLIYP